MILYMARSRTSGGTYIGITSRQLSVRIKEHCRVGRLPTRTHRQCVAFAAAIRKYGEDDFEWTIIMDGLTVDEAQRLERHLISTEKPRYNIAAGGLSGNGFAGSKRSPETIERMRIAAKKRGVSAAAHAARRERQRRPIICNETGTVFEEAAEAALAHGLPRATVYDLVYKGRVSKTAHVSFRYAD